MWIGAPFASRSAPKIDPACCKSESENTLQTLKKHCWSEILRPHDQRTTYIFGTLCQHDSKRVVLVLPPCNSAAMALHLAEIASEIAPGKHAVILIEQAGWHL